MTFMEVLMAILRGLGTGFLLSAIFAACGYAAWVVGGKIGGLEAEVDILKGKVEELQQREYERRYGAKKTVDSNDKTV